MVTYIHNQLNLEILLPSIGIAVWKYYIDDCYLLAEHNILPHNPGGSDNFQFSFVLKVWSYHFITFNNKSFFLEFSIIFF